MVNATIIAGVFGLLSGKINCFKKMMFLKGNVFEKILWKN